MKKYIVTVNGKKFEVEVEEAGYSDVAADKAGSSVSLKREEPVREEHRQEDPVVKPLSGRKAIKAPMPGTILDIRFSKGQRVKRGDVLFILEAMKMENEIMAGENATILDISVSTGAQVNTDDILAILE